MIFVTRSPIERFLRRYKRSPEEKLSILTDLRKESSDSLRKKQFMIKDIKKGVSGTYRFFDFFDQWDPSNRMLVFYEDLLLKKKEIFTRKSQ